MLAGLQAGMVGVLWMLLWLGIDSSWERQGFWSEENLFASLFYGSDSIRGGFSAKTLPGVALYLLLYSLLGCVFALAARQRWRPMRTLLAGLIFALVWFYVSFHVLWKSALPLVYLLYAERPMMVGHLIYGAWLARYPAYLPGGGQGAAPPAAISRMVEMPAELGPSGPSPAEFAAESPVEDAVYPDAARHDPPQHFESGP
jgi:hypothetical protein